MQVYVSGCGYVHEDAGACGSQKRASAAGVIGSCEMADVGTLEGGDSVSELLATEP